jgi:isocitrate dehydrogenase
MEDGIHTYDIYNETVSKEKVGTREFAQAVIQRLGKKPKTLKEAHYSTPKHIFKGHAKKENLAKKETVGVDVFVQSNGQVEHVHKQVSSIDFKEMKLTMISNRGVRVWPEKLPETLLSDSWRCRFVSSEKGHPVSHKQIVQLLQKLAEKGVDFTHTENLCTFDGKPGYTLAQDEQ